MVIVGIRCLCELLNPAHLHLRPDLFKLEFLILLQQLQHPELPCVSRMTAGVGLRPVDSDHPHRREGKASFLS